MSINSTTDEGNEPLLGLATTRELLREVAARMETTQNSLKGRERELGALCREAVVMLDAKVLDYRTVDGE